MDDLWKLNVKWKFLKIECFNGKFSQSKMHTWEKLKCNAKNGMTFENRM